MPADSQLERKSVADGQPSQGEDEPLQQPDPSVNRGQGKSFSISLDPEALGSLLERFEERGKAGNKGVLTKEFFVFSTLRQPARPEGGR